MATTIPRFAPTTTTGLRSLLLARRHSIGRSASALRREADDALSNRDLSDMFDHDDPSADADGASALMLIQHAEQRLWEVEQALARLEEGSYGYCTTCGEGIPLERLRALPATMSCVPCSDRWSFRTRGQIDKDRDAARHARWRSLSTRGGSGQEPSL